VETTDKNVSNPVVNFIIGIDRFQFLEADSVSDRVESFTKVQRDNADT